MIFTLLSTSFSLFAQDFEKSKEPYKASNGEIFEVGQIINLGAPGDFSNDFLYVVKGNDFIREASTGTVHLNNKTVNYDYRLKPREIKSFKIYPDHGTYAVVDNLFNIMINIDKALELREIMSAEHKNAFIHSSKKMTDSIAYVRMLLNEDTITIEQLKEYTYLFNKNKYKEIREDEFEFYKFLNSEKKRLQKFSLDLSDSLKLMVRVELGNYDFDRQGFPVLWNTSDSIKLLDDLWRYATPEDINKNQVDLTDLNVNFNNSSEFSFLPLNEERANFLIKHRKNYNGTVNRFVYFFIHFTTVGYRTIDRVEYYKDFISDEKVMDCKIFKICVFEDDFGYNWLNNINYSR